LLLAAERHSPWAARVVIARPCCQPSVNVASCWQKRVDWLCLQHDRHSCTKQSHTQTVMISCHIYNSKTR